MPDKIVQRIIDKMLERAAKGKLKYGVDLERPDLDLLAWLRHMQEELLDGSAYAERMIQDEEKKIEFFKKKTTFQDYHYTFVCDKCGEYGK